MNHLEMEFSEGITAVVGPNGCGKTNIVDAIRWVLGEQKTRLLRNTKMENVIFNGTKLRKPLGMAEVHLTLSNEDRALPLDYNEVMISRRLYRNGISEYRVNNEQSRLKAIRSLLLDTGLGNHVYSIITSEMIDSVLSDKEQDKKNMFEEAAGIMRYRVQREEALRKIKLTETDITRLEDVLGELDKEIRSLRYQRAKARRYMRLKEKVDKMEGALLKRNLHDLLGELDEAEEEMKRQAEITLVDESELSLRENRLQEKRVELAELERKLQALHENRFNLSKELQKNDETIAVCTERINAAEARMVENEEEITRAKRRISELQEELSGLKREIEGKEDTVASRLRALKEKETELRAVAGEFEEAKRILREKKQLVLGLSGGDDMSEHLKLELRDLEARKATLDEQTVRLRIEEKNLQDEVQELRRRLEEKKKKAADLQESIKVFEGRKEKLEALLKESESNLTEATIELKRIEEKRKLLESLKTGKDGRRPKEIPSGNGFVGVLADLVKVKKREYRKCIEACLAPIAGSLVARTKEDAFKALSELGAKADGGLQLLYPHASEAEGGFEGAGVVGRAIDLVECPHEAKDHVASLLGGIVVVGDVAEALDLLDRRSGVRVASLDGVFFDGPGRISIAPAGEIAMTTLDIDSKLKELDELQAEAQRRIRRGEMRRDQLVTLRRELSDEERDAVSLRESEEAAAEELLKEHRDKEIRLVRIKEKLTASTEASGELEKSMADLSRRLEQIRSAGKGDADGERLASEVDELEERIVDLEKRREILREDIGRCKLEDATAEGEVKMLESKAGHMEKLISELEELVRSREEDVVRARGQVEASKSEIARVSDATKGRHGELERIEKEMEELNAARESLQAACEEMEGELKGIKEERDRKREALERCKVALATRKAKIDGLIETAKEKFNEDLSPYITDRGLFDPSEWQDMDQEEFTRLKENLAAFGPVNMLALEEYEERKERYDFLVKQKNDLEEAKNDLLQAIRRINREARRLLNDTFETVRANFKATFQSLFEGGEADLMFVDSDDPLEANIKIVASPKGKRLHDISSLSGGERALVALSLLFAIYLVKPSPFCIFDEVDAPLDDANIGRFLNMLRSFTDRTQFIIITHNKRTMEAADFLYGVTMEEPGVSKIISVQLGEVDRLKAAKSARTSEKEESLSARI
jgi:chromosome segregation protein